MSAFCEECPFYFLGVGGGCVIVETKLALRDGHDKVVFICKIRMCMYVGLRAKVNSRKRRTLVT